MQRRNPLTRGAAIERVRGLLVDPDPASMDVALDVALEAGLSLADLGEMLAKEGPAHLASPESTGGWADEGRSAGEFILSNVRDEDDPRFMSVAWWVRRGPKVELFVNYHGQRWDETEGGMVRSGVLWITSALTPIIESAPPFANRTSTEWASMYKAVRSKTAALAWRVARELKEHSLVGSDAVRVAMALRHMTAPMPPRVAFNPMLGSKANPPRVYRAQKVVAKLEKEPRPAFARPGAIVQGPEDLVRDTLADYIGNNATEVFLILYVNVRNQIVGYNEYASGGTSGVEVHASGIMRDALASGAAAFITVHNHPSGDATPSQDDRVLWKRLREAGAIIGVPVIDNLVVGEDEYFSESQEEQQGLGRTKFRRTK